MTSMSCLAHLLLVRMRLNKKKATIFDLLSITLHPTMNKADLVNKIAESAGITKSKATTALETFVGTVVKTLKSGEKVTLMGFGTFSVSRRAARKGRNPKTGESIKIKAKKIARFRPSQELNARI
jgi:DNA-binding protein HU-beta